MVAVGRRPHDVPMSSRAMLPPLHHAQQVHRVYTYFISLHLISLHFISLHFISFHFTSLHFISLH